MKVIEKKISDMGRKSGMSWTTSRQMGKDIGKLSDGVIERAAAELIVRGVCSAAGGIGSGAVYLAKKGGKKIKEAAVSLKDSIAAKKAAKEAASSGDGAVAMRCRKKRKLVTDEFVDEFEEDAEEDVFQEEE